MVFHCFLIFLQKKRPIMPALCSMLHPYNYAQNYAGIMYLTLAQMASKIWTTYLNKAAEISIRVFSLGPEFSRHPEGLSS